MLEVYLLDAHYLQLLQNDLLPLFNSVRLDIQRGLWFIHDRYPAHFSAEENVW